MKHRKSITLITVFLLALSLSGNSALYAQERAGTSASPQLQIPLGGQYLDGSGAAADVNGIAGVLWNPAGLDAGSDDTDILAMFTRREHLADIGVNLFALGLRFDRFGTVAFQVRNFDIGDIEETDEFNSGGTGGTFSPTFFTVGGTYGLEMTDRIRVGVTSNVTYESFADISATSVTFDAGVQYATFLGVEDLNIGASVRNIGTDMTYNGSGLLQQARSRGANRPSTQFGTVAADAEVPTVVDLSAKYRVWRGLHVAATFTENTFKASQVHGQLSYNFRDLLIVRGAYSQVTEDRGDLTSPFEERPSFGGTLDLESALGLDVAFDYAFVPTEFFDNNHILSLRANF
jgi:hypothetical protein